MRKAVKITSNDDKTKATVEAKIVNYASIYEDSNIEDLEHDKHHLYCRIVNEHFTDTRLAYKIS